MKAYVGQTCSRKLIKRLTALGIGECTNRGEMPPRRTPFFYDNGAYSDWTAGREWDEAKWLSELDAVARMAPDFVVAPDIVAGGLDSLERSRAYLDRLDGMKPYLVVQDGMRLENVQAAIGGFSGVFVGGTSDWKLETGSAWVDLAHANQVPCHIGRVGTGRKVRWAIDIGADSIDSSLPLWSEGNLRVFLSALRCAGQMRFWT